MKISVSIIYALLFVNVVFAQKKDCTTALNILDKNKITLVVGWGIGDVEELQEESCDPSLNNIEEVQSYWITWSAYSSGTLTFDISPSDQNANLDFIVYELNAGCADKTPIRCLLSGPSSAVANDCTGDVGLAVGSTDELELPGCAAGSDNFLAPLNVEAGKEYALIINNISQTLQSIDVNFCGDALLGPYDWDCALVTSINEEIALKESTICFPNPATDLLFLTPEISFDRMMILDATGKIQQVINQPEGQVNISILSTGLYLLQGEHKGQIFTQKFIKQ